MHPSLQLPDLSQIKIHDKLWSHYTDMVAKVIIPYQWDILNNRIPDAEPSRCLDNFRIAAGEKRGRHQGVVFVDTDVYKWLEAVAFCIHNGSGTRFESIADDVIALIGRAQQDDGYLHTYYTLAAPKARWSNLVEGHELYNAGHLIEAAVAYYQATGKDALLNIARRFADLICKVFGPKEEQLHGYPGHQEIELALVKLYRCTGEKRYLTCAKFFLDERGKAPNYFEAEILRRGGWGFFPEFDDYDLSYSQSHLPVREQRTAEGHAVRAMYMCCAMADIAVEYEDAELMEACRALWRNVTQKRMYITGGIGSSSVSERFTTDYHLPNMYGYCETCASIGLALFGRRMFAIERQASYYDEIERALYNTVLAGISVEGNRYFYANPQEVWPEACMDGTSLRHIKPVRQRWFNVACCPTNVARTLASLGQYIYTQSGDTLYVNLFISSSINTTLAGDETSLSMESDLMLSGRVELSVKSGQAPVTVAIRIPHYAQTPVFCLNGHEIKPEVIGGYAYIHGDFSGKSAITVELNVKPRWVSANPLVRENAGKLAIAKGPCVYCLEQTDNGSNLPSLYVEQGAQVRETEQSDIPFCLPVLEYKGSRLLQGGENMPLYGGAELGTEPVMLRAIPYFLWCNRTPGEMLIWQKCRF